MIFAISSMGGWIDGGIGLTIGLVAIVVSWRTWRQTKAEEEWRRRQAEILERELDHGWHDLS